MATSEEVADLRRNVEQLRTEAAGANTSTVGAHEQLKEELKVQATIMNETENKVAATTAKLETLNKRVKRAVKDVQSDRLCMYMICFLLILALVGFILYQTGVVKK